MKSKSTLVPLLLLLASARAALSPFGPNAYPAVAEKDGCALILDGPGKSSAFDHTQNVFFGGAALYQGASTCITYSAVNAALAQALTYHRVEIPEQEWMPEQLATVGELFLDVTRILARRYRTHRPLIYLLFIIFFILIF